MMLRRSVVQAESPADRDDQNSINSQQLRELQAQFIASDPARVQLKAGEDEDDEDDDDDESSFHHVGSQQEHSQLQLRRHASQQQSDNRDDKSATTSDADVDHHHINLFEDDTSQPNDVFHLAILAPQRPHQSYNLSPGQPALHLPATLFSIATPLAAAPQPAVDAICHSDSCFKKPPPGPLKHIQPSSGRRHRMSLADEQHASASTLSTTQENPSQIYRQFEHTSQHAHAHYDFVSDASPRSPPSDGVVDASSYPADAAYDRTLEHGDTGFVNFDSFSPEKAPLMNMESQSEVESQYPKTPAIPRPRISGMDVSMMMPPTQMFTATQPSPYADDTGAISSQPSPNLFYTGQGPPGAMSSPVKHKIVRAQVHNSQPIGSSSPQGLSSPEGPRTDVLGSTSRLKPLNRTLEPLRSYTSTAVERALIQEATTAGDDYVSEDEFKNSHEESRREALKRKREAADTMKASKRTLLGRKDQVDPSSQIDAGEVVEVPSTARSRRSNKTDSSAPQSANPPTAVADSQPRVDLDYGSETESEDEDNLHNPTSPSSSQTEIVEDATIAAADDDYVESQQKDVFKIPCHATRVRKSSEQHLEDSSTASTTVLTQNRAGIDGQTDRREGQVEDAQMDNPSSAESTHAILKRNEAHIPETSPISSDVKTFMEMGGVESSESQALDLILTPADNVEHVLLSQPNVLVNVVSQNRGTRPDIVAEQNQEEMPPPPSTLPFYDQRRRSTDSSMSRVSLTPSTITSSLSSMGELTPSNPYESSPTTVDGEEPGKVPANMLRTRISRRASAAVSSADTAESEGKRRTSGRLVVKPGRYREPDTPEPMMAMPAPAPTLQSSHDTTRRSCRIGIFDGLDEADDPKPADISPYKHVNKGLERRTYTKKKPATKSNRTSVAVADDNPTNAADSPSSNGPGKKAGRPRKTNEVDNVEDGEAAADDKPVNDADSPSPNKPTKRLSRPRKVSGVDNAKTVCAAAAHDNSMHNADSPSPIKIVKKLCRPRKGSGVNNVRKNGEAAGSGSPSRTAMVLPKSTPTSGLFSNMAFCVSYTKRPNEKASVLSHISIHGGLLLESFDELFNLCSDALSTPSSSSCSEETALDLSDGHFTIHSKYADLGFVCLLGDDYSRKAKYMQALALGLPCISGLWVLRCGELDRVISWAPYMLAAGKSDLLQGAISGRAMQPFPAATARLSDIVAKRTKLLQDKRIIFVMPKGKTEAARKPYYFLANALGARCVRRVATREEAMRIASEAVGTDEAWDWVHAETDEGFSKKRKRSSDNVEAGERMNVGADPNKMIRVMTDEGMIQGLILGGMVGQEEQE